MLRDRFLRVLVLLRVVIFLVLILGITGCSSKSPSTSSLIRSTNQNVTPSGSQVKVIIKNFAFNPSEFSVYPGELIVVHNQDSVTHTMTAVSGIFNTGDIAPGQTKSFRAPFKPGIYSYYCVIHPFMTGTLIVK